VTKEENRKSSSSEPSVLDWVKSVLKFKPIPIPDPIETHEVLEEAEPGITSVVELEEPVEELSHLELQEVPEPKTAAPPRPKERWWSGRNLRLFGAVMLALFAQLALESKPENIIPAIIVYLLAGALAGWAVWAGDFKLVLPEDTSAGRDSGRVRLNFLLTGSVLTVLTFIASRVNEFTSLNLLLWAGALTSLLIAFWEGDPPFKGLWDGAKSVWQDRELKIRIQPWHLLVSASIALIVFFRFTRLEEVPYEMWSDHAEKLWDVMDVLDGKYSIFFPRNTGREAIQFYMAAVTAKFLGTGISFNTLKIGTILAGLLTLPYLYLFAKEYGGRYVGLAAMLFAGIAYWPNVISRIGLRFPLYPLFLAPAMYYLLRGLRLEKRNDFLLCGFAVGLGLHGYSPARVIPVAIMVGVLFYVIFAKSKAKRMNAFSWLIVAGVIALAVYTPLLGAVTDRMDIYLDRMVSRFTSTEMYPIPGPPLQVFLSNVWDGLKMFAWDDGEIWVISIPHRPGLDWITGAFFHLGVVIVFVRLLRQRRWQDLFLLVSIPILMLPSTLALAFPGENPALNRASGAIVPVFTLVATSWVFVFGWIFNKFKPPVLRVMIIGVLVFLFGLSASINYQLVFEEYAVRHRQDTWNASEIGAVMRGFANTIGSYETARIVRKEHWVDTRLVRIHAGDPGMDYGVWPNELVTLPPQPDRPQMFILKADDEEGLRSLQEKYPQGILRYEKSEVNGRDFMLYYVFPDESIEIDPLLSEP